MSQTKEKPRRRIRARSSLMAQGEPTLWLTGGSLMIAVLMILGLLVLLIYQGGKTFWPNHLYEIHWLDPDSKEPRVSLGRFRDYEFVALTEEQLDSLPPEVAQRAKEEMAQRKGKIQRQKVEIGNQNISKSDEVEVWIPDYAVIDIKKPEWALMIEREGGSPYYGLPTGFFIDNQKVATDSQEVWNKYQEHHDSVRERVDSIRDLEKNTRVRLAKLRDDARMELKRAEINHGKNSPQYQSAKEAEAKVEKQATEEDDKVKKQIAELATENARFEMEITTAEGETARLPLSSIVRAVLGNQLGFWKQMGVYASRWGEFVSADPRDANTAGGVYPAILGTVVLTMLMTVLVVPIGVLAALYLREYAKDGPILSAVRIAINNLAGVPSIVYGAFGLGFFCYFMGKGIDELFFPIHAADNKPVFGTGGLFWASLTLALLTLPVVIVSTEEALAAVPSSMREGSYACGASKWQTIRRIVIPRAMPGILTGMILAIARGAGEVAPLMFVGVTQTATGLPVDGVAPYLHLERSFMHLGFHIYYVGGQSNNSEAALPLVFTTALLLIIIIAVLNILAIWLRSRLKKRFVGGQF